MRGVGVRRARGAPHPPSGSSRAGIRLDRERAGVGEAEPLAADGARARAACVDRLPAHRARHDRVDAAGPRRRGPALAAKSTTAIVAAVISTAAAEDQAALPGSERAQRRVDPLPMTFQRHGRPPYSPARAACAIAGAPARPVDAAATVPPWDTAANGPSRSLDPRTSCAPKAQIRLAPRRSGLGDSPPCPHRTERKRRSMPLHWLSPGDNSWQLTAATLVGLMSVPGSSSSTAA